MTNHRPEGPLNFNQKSKIHRLHVSDRERWSVDFLARMYARPEAEIEAAIAFCESLLAAAPPEAA